MVVIENRSAYHNYFVDETLECGISLRGNEVKSIRAGRANIKDAWCQVQEGNLVLRGMFISKWDTSNVFDVDERRERQLLAHKREILKVRQCVSEVGQTLVPLKVYFSNGRVKVLEGICRGKHTYDKRNVLRNKDVNLSIKRALKEGMK